MCVIEERVEDGGAEGGIADDIVPVLDGDLAGEQRATAGIAVIEDEQPRPCEPLDELRIRPVPPGEGELVEEPGDAVVAGGDAEAAGLVAERTGEIGLSRPRRAGDEHGLAVPVPLAGGEAEHEGAVQPAGGLEVEVFDGGVEVEFGVAFETLVAALFPVGPLSFEEPDDERGRVRPDPRRPVPPATATTSPPRPRSACRNP